MARRQYTCGFCRGVFTPKKSGRKSFCSRECAFAMKGRIAAEVSALHRFASRNMRGSCAVCAASIPSRRVYCSDRCAARMTLVRALGCDRPIGCRVCGAAFCKVPGTWNRGFCSSECAEQHRAASRRGSRRAAKARRRAVERGAQAERIDPLRVFERDKWRCHICGRLTLKRLRGTTDPRAPELDHVVSLADGGAHTWGNVACACRECNGLKGARSFGQIGLAIAA